MGLTTYPSSWGFGTLGSGPILITMMFRLKPVLWGAAVGACLSFTWNLWNGSGSWATAGSPVPTLLLPCFWPWSLPTGLTFWLDLEAVPSLWTSLAIWTVSWGWLSLQTYSVRWGKMSWSQESHKALTVPTQVQIQSSEAEGTEQVQCFAQLQLTFYFYFKYDHHCLLASSRANEIQYLMEDADQNKGLVSSKISFISSSGP